MGKLKNVEGENVDAKNPHDSAAEKQADARHRRRVLVAFNTDAVPEKAFPASMQKVESHNRVIYCRPTVAVVKKLNLDEAHTITYDDKTGKIRIARGSKGAKSFQFLFPDNDNKNKLTSYSFPVPSWVNLAVFAKAIGSVLKDNKALDSCVGIITPNGITYPPGSLTDLLKLADRDSSGETQDKDQQAETPDNKTEPG
jgi:hypothetical protein